MANFLKALNLLDNKPTKKNKMSNLIKILEGHLQDKVKEINALKQEADDLNYPYGYYHTIARMEKELLEISRKISQLRILKKIKCIK